MQLDSTMFPMTYQRTSVPGHKFPDLYMYMILMLGKCIRQSLWELYLLDNTINTIWVDINLDDYFVSLLYIITLNFVKALVTKPS